MLETPVLPAILLGIGIAFGLTIQWARAARLPSRRWRAIGNSLGGLAVLAVILTNIGGLGSGFGVLFAMMPTVVVFVWAAADLVLLVALAIELNRLARTRDDEGTPAT